MEIQGNEAAVYLRANKTPERHGIDIKHAFNVQLNFSLFLSHTHTHTHTQRQTHTTLSLVPSGVFVRCDCDEPYA